MIRINSIEDWNKLLNESNFNDAEICYEIANYFDNGYSIDNKIIVEQNQIEAFNWYEKAYKKGNISAMTRIADYYSEGNICPLNIELAEELYKKGIEQDDAIATHNLAILKRDLQHFTEMFELYKLEQTLNNTSVIELAYCYFYGVGTEMDKKRAFEIFIEIADDANYRYCEYEIEDANYFIGLYYLEGLIVEKSIEKAQYYFEKANIDNDHRNANEMLLLIGKNNK